MTSIIYVGLDVHTSNYTACCYSMSDDRSFAIAQMKPEYKDILKYLNHISNQYGGKCRFLCGYEAGSLGYSLYHQLTANKVECVIMAPSTMPIKPGNRIKTDKRDFASYLGLIPGENSSSDKQRRTGITKAGNSHLRRLLIEAAQCQSKGKIGFKSKALKAQQKKVSPQVAAYSDRANERLKRKFHRIAVHSQHNIAKTAVARELACFIWGMMTDNYD